MATSELAVWIFLPGDVNPVLCGRVRADGPYYRFEYSRRYTSNPAAIPVAPQRYPLRDRIPLPRIGGRLPGPIDDAGPDHWGRRVIEYRNQVAGLGELDYLADSRGDRIGALHFQAGYDEYSQATQTPSTLVELLGAAAALELNQPLTPALAAALEHGTSIGGARPKALLRDGGVGSVAKFQSTSDRRAVVRAELATMQLAARCGLNVAAVDLQRIDQKDVLLVRRFDRVPVEDGTLSRRHLLSALTLLDLDETEARLASYPAFAELLIRHSRGGVDDARELFRRMVFNILVGNTDDHARNHAAFWDGQYLDLTPAYDLVPLWRAGQEASQAMEMGAEGRASTLRNALSQSGRFGLSRQDALALVDGIEETIAAHWRAEFEVAQVPTIDIEALAERAMLSPVARAR
ncbi:MAG: type II toxin-antitoxin system HipA family toxin [Pseudomonadota bacterium]|nr:type II toxin-antitoxin system HipA family toxin [Pseudomonadota bacterium]